ncbi:MAG TPA: DUF6152 family protein [Bryobacteraceae bacterium]|nr:DUF6152 family protein [Bryobacteraceae bacterium]
MKARYLSALVLGLAVSSLPALAHHSFAAEFDENKPVKVTGVVTKVEWLNPHIWFYVDAKDADGKVQHWAFSGGAPGQLMRRGITKDAIQPGMTVNVDGFRAKDGSNNANGNKVTFPDGRMVFTSSREPEESDTKRGK